MSLKWAQLDDLLFTGPGGLADHSTGLLSLITRPQRLQSRLQATRLVAAGDRLPDLFWSRRRGGLQPQCAAAGRNPTGNCLP